ncbi:uncharacterized protein LOC122392765 [Amphibalanus amphitrite]|uniref:uncharacterized protein LOC122392765 n=1 Tax=Amphibalanus amphitrite TaxID=1232801 RepID=UPI001C91873F|nr:uncharacterized protein LOC122392765 [Amphibalanus amphitrite]
MLRVPQGLRPSDALRFELLTTTDGSTRRLLADRLRQLQLLRGRDELLLRLLLLAGGARQSPATEEVASTGRPRRPDLDQLLSGPSPPTLGQLLRMAPPTRRQLIVHIALKSDG